MTGILIDKGVGNDDREIEGINDPHAQSRESVCVSVRVGEGEREGWGESVKEREREIERERERDRHRQNWDRKG